MTYSWLSAWYRNLGLPEYEVKPFVAAIYSDDSLLEIWPLGVYSKLPKGRYGRLGIKCARWLGHPDADYSGPVIGSGFEPQCEDVDGLNKARADLLSQIRSRTDLVFLDKIRCIDSSFTNIQIQNLTNKTYVGSRRLRLLSGSSAWQKLPKRIQLDTQRTWKQINAQNKIVFESVSSKERIHSLIKWILGHQAQRFTSQMSHEKLERRAAFYLDLISIRDPSSFEARVSTLKANGEIIAAHFGLKSEESFYYLVPAITSEGGWARYSPGRQLLRLLIEQSEQETLSYFDLGSSFHTWKLSFDPAGSDLMQLSGGRTFIGRAFLSRLQKKFLFPA